MIDFSFLGFTVRKVPTRDGSDAYRVNVPFMIGDSPAEIYVQTIGGQVRFFDEAFNLHTILALGYQMNDKRWESLAKALNNTGVKLLPSGAIELFAPVNEAPAAFATYLKAMTCVDSWINLPQKSQKNREELITLASIGFRRKYPKKEIIYKPMVNMPGRSISFDLLVNESTYVDVLFVENVWNFVRKVGHMFTHHPRYNVLGVVEDFSNQTQAISEKKAAGSFVPINLLSEIYPANRSIATVAT
jgi:hypothetical protein